MNEKTHDGRHGEGCFGCRIQGVQFDTRAMPSRRNTVAPTRANPAWEAGHAGQHRADGTFMPYIHEHTMNPIGLKEFGERKREFDPIIRDNQQHRATVT